MNKRSPLSYRAGNSVLHRCPAGLKLLLLLLLSVAPVLGLPVMAGAAVLILACACFAGLRLRELLAGSRPLMIMLLVFALIRALGIEDGSLHSPDLVIYKVRIDFAAIQNGLYLAAGILLCYTAVSLFFATTTTLELKTSLAKIEFFLLGVCRALPNLIKKMRKNAAFEHFIPCKLPKEPINCRILRLFTAKFYKSDRLLGLIRKPDLRRRQSRISLALTLMLGFLPRFFETWENARMAAKARGSAGGLKLLITILPLVTERMIETAAETAEALESRGLEL
ncbi:MAG: energy-coupling factor transporter transmembrane protein EcfT [Treponema sp.]|jgi:energy-coupling factor transporter transmembrane protein EcfT|nr:energy-coupling factor transporter transmembrane protein EcfT [Treponema sp.]